LVERPKLLVSHRVTRAELVSAGHTLVKLFLVPGAVALGYPRAARRAFFLFIRPFLRFSNRGKGNNCLRSRCVAACNLTH
jgi:hypothetical protein